MPQRQGIRVFTGDEFSVRFVFLLQEKIAQGHKFIGAQMIEVALQVRSYFIEAFTGETHRAEIPDQTPVRQVDSRLQQKRIAGCRDIDRQLYRFFISIEKARTGNISKEKTILVHPCVGPNGEPFVRYPRYSSKLTRK